MSEPGIESRVQSVLSEVFVLDGDQAWATVSTDTVEGWDSLQHLTLVLALEEEFGIQFDEDDTLALLSFPLIVETLKARLGDSAPA